MLLLALLLGRAFVFGVPIRGNLLLLLNPLGLLCCLWGSLWGSMLRHGLPFPAAG